jgi:Zn finger protein HypA/HybF involved in hydrogenase expression
MSTVPVICRTCDTTDMIALAEVNQALRCACGSKDLDLDDGQPQRAAKREVTAAGPSSSLNRDFARFAAGATINENRNQAEDVSAVSEVARCSSCLHEWRNTATDPGEGVPRCPNCGSEATSTAGSTSTRPVARRTAVTKMADLAYSPDAPEHFIADYDKLAEGLKSWVESDEHGSYLLPGAPPDLARMHQSLMQMGFANGYFAARRTSARRRNLVCGSCGHTWESRAQYRIACPNCGAEESVRQASRKASSLSWHTSDGENWFHDNPGEYEMYVRGGYSVWPSDDDTTTPPDEWTYEVIHYDTFDSKNRNEGGPFASADEAKAAAEAELARQREKAAGGQMDMFARKQANIECPHGCPVVLHDQDDLKYHLEWHGEQKTSRKQADRNYPYGDKSTCGACSKAITREVKLGQEFWRANGSLDCPERDGDHYPENERQRAGSRAKIAQIAAAIRRTNPGLPEATALRVATETVRRYPKVAAESSQIQCYECDHTFRKKIGPNTTEIRCPKCGGYDTNVAGY